MSSRKPQSNPLTSVKVTVRIRPTTSQDNHSIPSRWQKTVVQPSSPSSINIDGSSFSFDRVHGPSDTQDVVYNDNVEKLVQSFVDGYNITVLAYGQTSSGKSYTMGTSISDETQDTSFINSSTGIVPRAVDQIFHSLEAKGVDFSVKNSFIEIYNEDLIDLLSADKNNYVNGSEKTPVTIREASNGTIIWSGLREPQVSTSHDVLKNLRLGSNVRKTNETEMNSQSSRSHAIFSLTLTQKKYVGPGNPPSSPPLAAPSTPRSRPVSGIAQRVTSPTFGRPSTPTSFKSGLRPPSSMSNRSPSPSFGKRMNEDEDDGNYVTITSKFHFVDLAGSERLKRTAAQGARASEAISINSGLLALGNVISALGDPSKARAKTYIPYRDSKLTRLLQDSLGGNAQTTMIACVSPAEYNTNETINTLKYANRARNIKNKAEVNQVDAGWEDIEWLQSTVTKLRKELGALKAGKIPEGSSREEVEYLENKYEESTSELEKLRLQLSNAEGSPNVQQKASSFAEMVAPVIEEYERTINTLESELKLTKAAVSHTNMVYSERESEFDELVDRDTKNSALVQDLHVRLQKLLTRESTTEAYVKDLESQLKTLTEGDDTYAAALVDVRKDLTKHRETESKNEQYILDLESKLKGVEQVNFGLIAQVEKLEKEAHERDEQLEQLEERLNLYNDGDDKNVLLSAIDEGSAKHADLEARLDELMSERETLLEESASLKKTAEQEGVARNDAIKRLDEVESEKTKLATALKLEGGKVTTNGVKEITPPNTPEQRQSQDEQIIQSEMVELRGDLQKIQLSQKKTLNDLESLQSRYRDALKEIGELTGQIEENKLMSATEDGVIATGPQPATHILDQSTGKLRRKLSFESGGITLPSGAAKDGRRNSLSIPRRNSMQNLQSPTNMARTSAFFGRQPLVTSPGGGGNGGATTPTTPTTPQPPSPANQNGTGKGHTRAPSLLLSQELSSHRQSRSSWAGPPSPGVSPRLSMNNLQVQQPTRSVESLEREIQTLQKTLKDRDDEIDMLEKELPQLKRASYEESGKKAEDKGIDGDKDVDIKEEHIARYNELMSSMAIKESAHSEQIEKLKSSYDVEKRQNEDLKSLTKIQITNMSTEVEAYRNKLEEREDELKKLEQQLEEAEKEFLTAKKTLTDSHSIELASLKAQHEEAIYNTNLEYDKTINEIKSDDEKNEERDVERNNLIEKIKMSHENSLEGIKKEYEEVVNVLKSSNETLIKEIEEVKNKMTSNHEGTVHEIRRKHKEEIERASLLASNAQNELHEEHLKVIDNMKGEHDEKLVSERDGITKELDEGHSSRLRSLEEELLRVKESLQGQEVENIKTKEQLSGAEAERDELASKRYEGGGDADEVVLLRSQLQSQREKNESDQKEFAEALTTMKELEKMMEGAIAERDSLLAQVNDFTSRNNSYEYQQLELTRSKEEISALTHERLRLENALRDYENIREKDGELQSPVLMDAAPKSPRLSRGNSGGSNVPPPTPPPSIPPPPPPQNGKQRQSTSSRPESAASVRSQNDMHPDANKQLEEAEQQIKTLTKQLDHCEADLQANIDLVQTLENALMDSERSLRKARVNMNDLVKDRDVANGEVTILRQEIDSKQQEIDNTRSSVVEERRQSAMKLDQERSQRDRARAQLEQRVEDMQKRKSKLRCF